MPVDRLLPSEDATELIALTRDVADKILDPIVDVAGERDQLGGVLGGKQAVDRHGCIS